MTGLTPRILVVSASDHGFMPLLREMIASIAPLLARDRVDMACFDIGLHAPDRQWLAERSITTAEPVAHFGLDARHYAPTELSFLARPFLREYFPGYDVYFWIDSDVWLQDVAVLDAYINGAVSRGLAVSHESDPGYRFQAWLLGWTAKHFALGYGAVAGMRLLARRHLNAGMFAAHADAVHWRRWASCYHDAIRRSGMLVPHDQFALNQAIYSRPLSGVELLDPTNNWICDRGVPMWSDVKAAFCKPYPPHDVIGALHLAGPAKRSRYRVCRTGGGSFETCIVRGASPERPGQHPLSPIAGQPRKM